MTIDVDERQRTFARAALRVVTRFAMAVVALYVVTLIAAIFGTSLPADLHDKIFNYWGAMVGVPCAAIGALAIVMLLLSAFEPGESAEHSKEGKKVISLKLFGLEFTGPSGPVTLWLACFLALVAGIYWLSKLGSP